MKYNDGSFEHIFEKGETWKNDFILTFLTDEIETTDSGDLMYKLTLLENGESFPMSFEETMRDGEFQDDQLFAVWEKRDVEGLINKLQDCLRNYK